MGNKKGFRRGFLCGIAVDESNEQLLFIRELQRVLNRD
jgi:hypothetical protein